MKKHYSLKIIYFFIFLNVFPFLLNAEDLKIPVLTGRVVDETFTLTEEDKSVLTEELKKLETEKGSQIAVLVINTVGGLTIEEYGIKIAEAWKLGRKDVSDGAVLIVAMKDRRMRIEVGRGLEGFLTDLKTKQIQEKIIKPEFRNGNFSGGIRKGAEAMITLAKGAELPLPVEDPRKRTNGRLEALFVVLIIIAGLIVKAQFHSLIGKAFVALLFTFFVYWYTDRSGSFIATVFFTSIAAILLLQSVIFPSRKRRGGTGSSGGNGGVDGFVSSSSGSGGSSFSGGGGDFGGGGSSSNWD